MAVTTKKASLEKAVTDAVGAGREIHLETVDFSDPNRPKTCLEVDFPILPINQVAAIEGNAGKPIYQMSKWWARRRSSVFRAMLIAAATKAPEDSGEAAKTVWDSYYGNHQNNVSFRKLKVADIFMGGGTTVVEGARLGMQMYGNDLNPVAWFIVKNALADVDSKDVERLLGQIKTDVKPSVMPFYACDCPRGHKGQWKTASGKELGADFDPLSLPHAERSQYRYEGPEFIYTFWVKHGPCQATECDHRTPIMSSPIVSVKTLTVKAWTDRVCVTCAKLFDVERHDARMAPSALYVIAATEKPHSVMDVSGKYVCPHCSHKYHDEAAAVTGSSTALGKAKNKSIELALLVHPDWLKGSSGHSTDGKSFGGSVPDSPEATAAWYAERAQPLKLIEVRGTLPPEIVCPDTGELLFTDDRGGNVRGKSSFTCAACGTKHDVLSAMSKFGKSGPVSPLVVQGFCAECDHEGRPYGGRFFDVPDNVTIVAAQREWYQRSSGDLSPFWPRTALPEGFKTTYQRIPEHGYPRFVDMFNPRQLLLHTQLLKAISGAVCPDDARDFVLGAFQQYLRNQCMFSFWHISHDHFAPTLSNNNYHPKSVMIEVGAFTGVGYGPWPSAIGSLGESLDWKRSPWEIVSAAEFQRTAVDSAANMKSKGCRVYPGDQPVRPSQLSCGSASHIKEIEAETIDLVITDPPFGNNIQYSELADFFYVWLRLALQVRFPFFAAETTPKAVEVVSNPVRNPEDPDGFFQKMLTECWREAHRILRPGGILSFTFHHSEDEPWVAVLESLFRAGFYLEAAYPIRSDETKGEGAKPGTFGSQLIEYDIIHVCRKRVEHPQAISWARLRRQIMQDVGQLRDILEQHQTAGLQEADLQVIRRGKALEYYSKHYGRVYVEKGREFTVREALAGINMLLDDERDTSRESPPVLAEPYTRQFLRLFADKVGLPRDQMQKFLRGTGVSPGEFVARGWCHESGKVFHVTSPMELAQTWKGIPRNGMSRDFDQAMFLIGACYENSGIRVQDTLNSTNFVPHPAVGDILGWVLRHGSDSDMKNAARLAKQLYDKWLAANKPKVEIQRTLFDLDPVEA